MDAPLDMNESVWSLKRIAVSQKAVLQVVRQPLAERPGEVEDALVASFLAQDQADWLLWITDGTALGTTVAERS